MTHHPSLLTIVLNYRTPEMTLGAARAALREMEGIDGAITIVDNDSGDGSYEMMAEAVTREGMDRDDRVRVIQSGHNGGFGAGNNVGIRAGLPDGRDPDYIYLLNSDACPDEGAIRALLDYVEARPEVGVAGSFVHGPDGAPHETAFRFPSIASDFETAARTGPISRLLERHIVALPLPRPAGPVDWVSGASLMLRRAALEEIGIFDETFFLYFEETELCHRARHGGWDVHYVPEAAVTHIGSVSTGMKKWARVPQYWFDSRLHYFLKTGGRAHATAATVALVAGGLVWRVRRLIQRKPRVDSPYFLRDAIAHAARAAIRGTGRPGGGARGASSKTAPRPLGEQQ